ncbi:DUF202 domain-containing protein [Demequina rhizosphaerae]|uniref:DUF202 domain-containing protein n=1 Tax=Demequina rhizosphaerae TaxID=1638985 RepID=UPI0007866B90|nr:DUF202 domain-containing protein [Demequina rhizosphaerae]
MSEDRPYDEGLALERTALAWQRTALAFAIASLGAAGVFIPVGAPAVALAFGGSAFGIATLAVAALRYRAAHRHLHRGGGHLSPGLAVAVLSGSVLLLGVACVVYTVVIGLGRG